MEGGLEPPSTPVKRPYEVRNPPPASQNVRLAVKMPPSTPNGIVGHKGGHEPPSGSADAMVLVAPSPSNKTLKSIVP